MWRDSTTFISSRDRRYTVTRYIGRGREREKDRVVRPMAAAVNSRISLYARTVLGGFSENLVRSDLKIAAGRSR